MSEGTGRLAYEDRDVVAGTRYGYRVGMPEGSAQKYQGEVWLDIPGRTELSLAGFHPNPATSQLNVRLTLPRPEPVRLEILDLSGRRLIVREIDNLGQGAHDVSLGGAGALPAGVYMIRLSAAGRTVTAKGAVLR
jgi:hypothetical protein